MSGGLEGRGGGGQVPRCCDGARQREVAGAEALLGGELRRMWSRTKDSGFQPFASWNPDLNLRLCGGALSDLSKTPFPFMAKIAIDHRAA